MATILKSRQTFVEYASKIAMSISNTFELLVNALAEILSEIYQL